MLAKLQAQTGVDELIHNNVCNKGQGICGWYAVSSRLQQHLQVVLDEVSLDGIAQGPSRGGGLLNSREEVAEQSHEEGQVQVDQLGLDEVQHGAVHDQLF